MTYKRIFVISLFKNASTSFHWYFKKAYKINSKHGGNLKRWNQKLSINKGIPFKNHGSYCFASIEGVKIDILSQIYPKDKYILPTRPFFNWIISIINWYNLGTINYNLILEYLSKRNNYYKLIEETLNKNNFDFLLINIKEDDIKKNIDKFLGKKDISLSFHHRNITKQKKNKKILKNNEEILNFIKNLFIQIKIDTKEINESFIINYNKNNKIINNLKLEIKY